MAMLSNGNKQTWMEVKIHESMYRLRNLFNSIEMNEDIEKRKSTIVSDNTTRMTSTTKQLVILTLPSSSSTIPRDLWTNKIEFLLSVIGYVVDLGMKKTIE